MTELIASLLLTLGPCHVAGIPTEVLCGEFEVPRSADPATGTLTLKLTLVPAHADRRSDDAVLVLAGGPGQAVRRFAGQVSDLLPRTRTRRDLVFVDQRGTGGSAALDCPPMPLGIRTDTAAGWVSECRAQLPPDLENFSHAMTIADFEALRRALGYSQWNLLGGSMGTRLAQLYMRAHPDAIRSAVLDGVAPLDVVVGASMGADAQPVLDAVFAGSPFPDLAGRFRARLDALADDPVAVTLPHPVTGEPITRTIDRDGLALLVRALLYSARSQRLLPWLLHRAADGDFVPLLAMQETFVDDYAEMMSFGLTANILCSEDIGRAGVAAVPAAEAESFVGLAQAGFWLDVCAAWPRYPVDDAQRTSLVSDIPTLLVSGELDPVTPPRYGERVAATLTDARHLIVPGGDHTVAFQGGRCLGPILDAFIDDADPAAVDDRCVARQAPAAPFTRATGFHPAEGAR